MKEPRKTIVMTYRRGGLIVAMNVLLALAAVAAVAALVLEYGFRTAPVRLDILHAAQMAVVAVFVLDRFARTALARKRREYLRDNWTDFALIALAAAATIIAARAYPKILSAGALYVLISQAYLLGALILRAVNMNLHFAGSGIHPTWLLIGSFALLSLGGSGLLMLPAATPQGSIIYYPDALFTSVSATCVTGLVVRDTGQDFTPFGQAVILGLIQLGGLGIMIFGTVLAILVGKSLSVRSSSALGEMMAAEAVGKMGRTAVFVVLVTLILEAVGVALFWPMFAGARGPTGEVLSGAQVAWFSIFHSISSFCNAGFSLYGRNMMADVRAGGQALRDNWQIPGVMAPLIVLGGLGFPVLQDCAAYAVRLVRCRLVRLRRLRAPGRRRVARPKLTLHSRIVLVSSAVLIVGGALLLLAVEPSAHQDPGVVGRVPYRVEGTRKAGDWASMPPARRLREAMFQSISARTAGFNTINVAEMSNAGKLTICGLMVIGGSPASTAGGVKTVTVALLVLTVWCVLKRRRELEVRHRSIPADLLWRAVTLVVLYAALLGTITLLLCVAMRREAFGDLLFEACSACGTVGLSTGVTARLNVFAKYVIVAGMFIGRLGPLTLLLALTSRVRRVEYAYPEENVLIG